MGKASKWIKNFLTGRKSSSHQPTSVDTHENMKTPISVPLGSSKDKRIWSFRKPSTTETYQKESTIMETTATMQAALVEAESEQKRHAMSVAIATADAADAAVAAAQAANKAMLRLTKFAPVKATSVEDIAATKIQSVFRSYLARKALFALKGLVKVQAWVRGHLVRKQATATLRCLQALLTVQARARARRIKMIDEPNPYNQRQSIYTKSTPDDRFTYPVHDHQMEDHIKIVEMDIGDTRGSTKSRISYFNNKQTDNTYSTYHQQYSKQHHQLISPAPSEITNMSHISYSGHFNEHFCSTTHSRFRYDPAKSKADPSNVHSYKPENADDMCYEYQFFPKYMANTKSSKAKFRSQSAPKQRPADTFQRQPSKRRVSIEGRNVPRPVRMERSSSLVCPTPENYQYPWSIELDKMAVSIKESECGSNSTMLTNSNYCRSVVGYNVSSLTSTT